MMQAASDELLKKEKAGGTHIPLRELWEHANYETDLTWPQTYHLEECEDCLSVLALCRFEDSFADLEKRVEDAHFFRDHENRD